MTDTEAAAAAEQAVLGGMMTSTRAATETVMELRAGDFSVPRHGIIFDALTELTRNGSPTDAVAVTDELIRTGKLLLAGGADYLYTLTDAAVTASNVSYYADMVRNEATRRGLHEIGTRLTQPIPDPGVAMAQALNELSDLRDQSIAGATDAKVRWLNEVLDVPETDDAPEWVIPGVVERRDRLALTASEGAGKSTLLRQIAVMSAAGLHPFRRTPITPVRVLVVDAENSERQWRRKTRAMAERAAMVGQRDPRPHVALRCVEFMDITSAADIGLIHKWMDESQPDLVILGPLYRMVSGGLEKAEETQAALRALDSIRARNVAMFIELHAGHATSREGERNLRPVGSSQMLRWPEFGLGLTREKELGPGGKARYRFVKWRGDRDERHWPHLMRGQEWPWEVTQ